MPAGKKTSSLLLLNPRERKGKASGSIFVRERGEKGGKAKKNTLHPVKVERGKKCRPTGGKEKRNKRLQHATKGEERELPEERKREE